MYPIMRDENGKLWFVPPSGSVYSMGGIWTGTPYNRGLLDTLRGLQVVGYAACLFDAQRMFA